MSAKKNTTMDHFLETAGDNTGYLGFPPFDQPLFEAPYVLTIQLETQNDVEAFVALMGDEYETLLEDGKRSVKSYWYPTLERGARGGGGVKNIWVEIEDGEQ